MDDSAGMRRRLRVELKRLRNDANLTQRAVADKLDWSPSKVIRIESGEVSVSVVDLRALAALYKMESGPELDQLANLARGSRRQPFSEYRDLLPKDTIKFFGYEHSASLIRSVQPLIMPGLFQIEEYSRALFRATGSEPKEVERIIASRRERQELFDRDDPPEIFSILDEAVLHRQIGGRAVMRRQLEHLLALSERPRISIQVMPFARGAYSGLHGSYIYLEFPDASDPDVVFLDGARGPVSWIDDPSTTADYQEAFVAMEDLAAPRTQLAEYVERALAGFGPG